jgi:ribosome-binding protein aMBF1 (putative translation factor)
MRKKNTTTLSEFKDKHYGRRGTVRREKLEKGYEAFRLGAMLQEARKERGMTQQQLADKCGTTKSYISRIENDLKEVRISTLQKIVESGLGGHLEVSIKFFV